MRVTLGWLKEFIQIDPEPTQVADDLTMLGLEVDAFGPGFTDIAGVVAARIESIKPHPQADKLTLVEISCGDQATRIVCGAQNIAEGQIVPFAGTGTMLPGGFKIKKTKIRGVPSEGMLCSAKELGLGDDHDGILILDEKCRSGHELVSELGLDDTVFDLGITPNRGDCLSILGVARDLAAQYKIEITDPEIELPPGKGKTADYITLENMDADLCPRYAGRVVYGVQPGESPLWMKARLWLAGFRPINNIVDVTNYVMIERGQPLHAFDLDLLNDRRIEARRAAPGEKLALINDEEVALEPEMLVIADGKGPVALAGVMGGKYSEIIRTTSNILIESAHFDPASVRRTARKLGVSSESSYRFERFVDPEGSAKGANRAASLIMQLAGGATTEDYFDSYEKPYKANVIELNLNRASALVGTHIPAEESIRHLKSAGCAVKSVDAVNVRVRAPSWRPDITEWADLIEEITRLHGCNNIPEAFPDISFPKRGSNPVTDLIEIAQRYWVGRGFHEAVNYSFVSERDNLAAIEMWRLGTHGTIVIANPLGPDQAVMRSSLIPGLLQSARRNANRQNENIRLFEAGRAFWGVENEKLPDEPTMVGAVQTASVDSFWDGARRARELYDLKGDLEGFLLRLGVREYDFSPADFALGREEYVSYVTVNGEIIGVFGQVLPAAAEKLDLRDPVYFAEINLDRVAQAGKRPVVFQPFSAYPPVKRDLGLVAPEGIPAGEIMKIVRKYGGGELVHAEIIDLFRGEKIPAGTCGLVVRMTFQSMKETIRSKRIDRAMNRIANQLKREHDISLREQ